jgi:HPt (histidine-containing phosphotransfer) domain-containing protein
MMTRNRSRDEYISAAAKESNGKISIPGVDTDGGIFNMGGSAEAYHNILNVVLEDGRKKIVYLEKYAVDNNIKAYNIETHALKSVAASIGANTLSQIAAQHEAASVNGDAEFVKNNYRQLINEYTSLLRNIEEYLTVNNLLTVRVADMAETADAQPISNQKKHNEVVEAIRLIERFDSDGAIERLCALLKYHLDKSDRSAVKRAINQLDDYMFDEAIQTLSLL